MRPLRFTPKKHEECRRWEGRGCEQQDGGITDVELILFLSNIFINMMSRTASAG